MRIVQEGYYTHSEPAFLSAYHTAVGDEFTPDKVLHLAARMQIAGFNEVIGTLWNVDDTIAHEVVTRFYREMFGPLCGRHIGELVVESVSMSCMVADPSRHPLPTHANGERQALYRTATGHHHLRVSCRTPTRCTSTTISTAALREALSQSD